MTKRLIKQLIIASVFLAIIVCVILLIFYFQKPNPTCFDGIKNQNEEEIDCGGPCISCELVNIKPLEVLWTKVISNKDGFYDLAAEIRNPNQNYGSGKFEYKFRLYDYNDNLIDEFSGNDFIMPNQKKYIVETRIENENTIYRTDLDFVKVEWGKPYDYLPPEFAVKQKEYYFLKEGMVEKSQAKAIVVNETNFDFEEIDVDVLLFNSMNNLIAVNETEIRTLPINQERDFVVTWFYKIDDQVSRIEIEPETNIFNENNYIPVGTKEIEEFQEY